MHYHAGYPGAVVTFVLIAFTGCSSNPPPDKTPPEKPAQDFQVNLKGEGRIKEIRLAELAEDHQNLNIHVTKDADKHEYFLTMHLLQPEVAFLKSAGKLSVKDDEGVKEAPVKTVPRETHFYIGFGDLAYLDRVIVVGLARKQKLLVIRFHDKRIPGEEAQPFEKHLTDEQFAVLDQGGTVVLYVRVESPVNGLSKVVHKAAPTKVEDRALLFLPK